MDLFTPVIHEELQHPNFRAICAQQNGYNWDVLNEWARGFKDRDGKFVAEFQRTFDSSFWELYVFAVLKQYRINVDFSHAAPDFLITSHGGFNVEATVALHAKDATPEYMKFAEPIPADLNEFNRRTILRIRNSIDNKRKRFAESYSTLDHVKDRPFVLAITAFSSPHAGLACQRAIEAVLFGYYVDEERAWRAWTCLHRSEPFKLPARPADDVDIDLAGRSLLVCDMPSVPSIKNCPHHSCNMRIGRSNSATLRAVYSSSSPNQGRI
jgi:hypothetical protein